MAMGVTISYEIVFEKVEPSGEMCKKCKEPVFGVGYKMIICVKVSSDLLPIFKDSDIIVCQTCKDAIS